MRTRNAFKWATLAAIVLRSATLAGTDGLAETDAPSSQLSLPVISVVERYPPYADFCLRHQRECDLSGPAIAPYSTDFMEKIVSMNVAVNIEIKFMSDINQFNEEDYWALPTSGYGDCEDLALEKRSRLVKSGVAPAALRLAFVSHRKLLNSHAILTVETSKGTYVLDSYSNEVSRWDQVPYNFEARERTDGLWDRFDQANWGYDR